MPHHIRLSFSWTDALRGRDRRSTVDNGFFSVEVIKWRDKTWDFFIGLSANFYGDL